MSSPPLTTAAPTLHADAVTIALVGFAHATSHFFHLMLPPLYPWLMREFALGYTEVGLAMTVFFVVSGVGQAFAGVVVDRHGAHRVLCAGIGLLVLAAVLVGLAPGFPAIVAAAAVAGLGNSVFHPADFALLNHRVSEGRLGHAFAVHGLSGNLGWAAGPVLMLTLASAFGWRTAAFGAAGVGALALAFLLWQRPLLIYSTVTPKGVGAAAASAWTFLRVPTVWFAFAFFLFSTLAFGALQNFAPSLLNSLYGLSMLTAASALTGYLLGSASGLLVGGFLVKRGQRQESLIAAVLAVAALVAFGLAAQWWPSGMVIPAMVLMGFCVGLSGPSRDMLVRRATAARLGSNAFGRVYGMVYSGLDVGLALAPLLFGLLLDAHREALVFLAVAAAFVAAIAAAGAIARVLPERSNL